MKNTMFTLLTCSMIVLAAFSTNSLFGQDSPQPGMEQEEVTPAKVETDGTYLVLDVGGMTCQGCANGVDAKLKKIDGIISCKTTFADGSSKITYDPSKVTEKKIMKAIKAKGYSAKVSKGDNE